MNMYFENFWITRASICTWRRLVTQGGFLLGPMGRGGCLWLLLLFIGASVNAQSEIPNGSASPWKFVSDEEQLQIYYAPKTVVVDFDNRLVWELWNFKTPKDYMYSATGRIEIDCKRKRERLLMFWGYNEPMGRGRSVNMTTDVGSWAPLTSNSVKLKTYCEIK